MDTTSLYASNYPKAMQFPGFHSQIPLHAATLYLLLIAIYEKVIHAKCHYSISPANLMSFFLFKPSLKEWISMQQMDLLRARTRHHTSPLCQVMMIAYTIRPLWSLLGLPPYKITVTASITDAPLASGDIIPYNIY